MKKFSHLNAAGEANMVDVSDKADTARTATARARVILNAQLLERVREQSVAKGDLLAIARIAGIQGAKKCADLIPLCHPLPLSKVNIDIEEFVDNDRTGLQIIATCRTTAKTGVEMEALTAASVSALTIYDMCKAFSHDITIQATKLMSKSGGKRDFNRS